MTAASAPHPMAGIVKEAAIAAAVAAALCLPLVGLHIEVVASDFVVFTRFPDMGVAVLLVFLGRLGLGLIRAGALFLPFVLGTATAAVGSLVPMPSLFLSVVAGAGGAVIALAAAGAWAVGRRGVLGARGWRRPAAGASRLLPAVWRTVAVAGIAAALILPFMPFADRRLLDIGILVMTYVMLGWGLNIVVGLAGLLDLGYVAFYAVGAYSFALLAQYFGLGFWEGLPLAGLIAAIFGLLLGFPVLRLRGDYLAIVTLGFGEMIRIILTNWVAFTNGPNGISGIPRPTFFGLPFRRSDPDGGQTFHQVFGLEYDTIQRIIFLYYVILGLALITNFFTLRMRRLPIGRAWEALREDEIACRALGINPTNTKLTAFAIGAMFGGFAGSFFATRQGFISPESFTFLESAIILAIVVLGGMGSQIGVVIAAIVLIGIPEWFRELQEYRMLAFGAGMVLIMMWRPRGLLAHREPTIRLADPQ